MNDNIKLVLYPEDVVWLYHAILNMTTHDIERAIPTFPVRTSAEIARGIRDRLAAYVGSDTMDTQFEVAQEDGKLIECSVMLGDREGLPTTAIDEPDNVKMSNAYYDEIKELIARLDQTIIDTWLNWDNSEQVFGDDSCCNYCDQPAKQDKPDDGYTCNHKPNCIYLEAIKRQRNPATLDKNGVTVRLDKGDKIAPGILPGLDGIKCIESIFVPVGYAVTGTGDPDETGYPMGGWKPLHPDHGQDNSCVTDDTLDDKPNGDKDM